MRQVLSTALVALVVAALTAVTVSAVAQSEPETIAPAAVSDINAHRVDGKHAVSAGTTKSQRAGKLVATNSEGLLPSNIVKPQWGLIQGVPAGFADGIDNRGVTGMTVTMVDGVGTAIAAGDTGFASANCPAGSKVIGGGFGQDGYDIMVSDSFRANPTRWTVLGRNTTAGNQSLFARAMCLSVEPSAAFSAASTGATVAKAKR